MQLFNSKGIIALEERNLIIYAVCMMLIIVIPVFIATVYIAIRYRETSKTKYDPDEKHSPFFVPILWAIPTIIILILSTTPIQTMKILYNKKI